MKNIETYKKWIKFLSETRKAVSSLGYLEVKTPVLVESPAMEAYLEGFKLENNNVYLPTSPEFGLKRVWLSGDKELGRIFEVAHSFRAEEEQSKHHLSEFTMLEIYDETLEFDDFIKKMGELCKEILGLPVAFNPSFVSLPELFFSVTGKPFLAEFGHEELLGLCEDLKVGVSDDDTVNDLFQRLYLEFIEPVLSHKDFVILKDYPPFLSALSKISDEGWSRRFEFYFSGLELANGYDELLDPDLVKKRWDYENHVRLLMSKKPHPIDQKLIKALEKRKIDKGCGVAIGLERLFYIKEKLNGSLIKLTDTQI